MAAAASRVPISPKSTVSTKQGRRAPLSTFADTIVPTRMSNERKSSRVAKRPMLPRATRTSQARARLSSGRMSFLIFVYGSLRRGQANHAELLGADFVGDAHTA